VDLSLTQDERKFRDEFRDWIRANVPAEPLEDWRSNSDPSNLAGLRDWERRLFEAGWAGIAWPTEYGGRGKGPIEELIFGEEYIRAAAPPRLNDLPLAVVGPVIIAYGTDEQKQRMLRPLLSAQELWCQGYSEPDAGSDLAAVRTRAVKTGAGFRVSGHKVWTSLGHHADWMLTLVSTTPSQRHRGLTCVLLDLHSEGVKREPLRQITGDPQFAEVFLDDVEVPGNRVLGGENNGWNVVMTALECERSARMATYLEFYKTWEAVRALALATGEDDLRMRAASAYAELEAFRLLSYQMATARARGERLGPRASVAKLHWSEMNRRLHELALDALGPEAELGPGAPASVDGGRWAKRYLYARAATIYAGTNEIQRTIIAERLLGLPAG
jgi:alkylation response protein AidB-like acyl-CoA dehydrogenase